jgi:acyl-[acyl-carrier-protein]-phospholipid O-acyltransferase/long-chain-fatty-acid--[acyl-carrier-protein] ligase
MRGFNSSRWTALFLSNFLGVFNDNILKNAIIFIAVTWSLPSWLSTSQLISIVSASLIIPYLLLSPLGGRLAVRYSKLKVFRFFKFIEFPIILVACIAFYYQWVLLAVFSVLLMGVQSCLYSPSKYSLIKDIGGLESVSFGSGVFETMAFLGILFGAILASIIADNYSFVLLVFVLVLIATLGFISTWLIKAKEMVPDNAKDNASLNPLKFIKSLYLEATQYEEVNIAVFGVSLFWLIGGVLQMNLIIHSKNIYLLSNTAIGLVMSIAAIGIAVGSWVTGVLSGKSVQRGFIVLGLASMLFFLFLLSFVKLPIYLYVFSVFALAFSGAFFQVPSLSMLQFANLGRRLGDMVAYLNLVTFIFVLLGSVLFSLVTFVFDENSYIVFAVLMTVTALTLIFYLQHSKNFLSETRHLFIKK